MMQNITTAPLRFLMAAAAVATFSLCLAPGTASARCAAWDFRYELAAVKQSNGVTVSLDKIERRGNLFTAYATYRWAKLETYMGDFFMPDRQLRGDTVRGSLDGRIDGDVIELKIYWLDSDQTIGFYRGHIGEDGRIVGGEHWVYQRPGERFSWSLVSPLECRRVSGLFRPEPAPSRSEADAVDPGGLDGVHPYDPRASDSVRLPPALEGRGGDRPDPDRYDPGSASRPPRFDPDRTDPGSVTRQPRLDPDRASPDSVSRPPRLDPDRSSPGPVGSSRSMDPGRVSQEPGGMAGALERCINGFVWREARAGDRVCVTPAVRERTQRENARAPSLVDPAGGPYACLRGYVWREAFDGDTVCVTPQTRGETLEDNRMAPARRR